MGGGQDYLGLCNIIQGLCNLKVKSGDGRIAGRNKTDLRSK